jgi:hypothetical protein
MSEKYHQERKKKEKKTVSFLPATTAQALFLPFNKLVSAEVYNPPLAQNLISG